MSIKLDNVPAAAKVATEPSEALAAKSAKSLQAGSKDNGHARNTEIEVICVGLMRTGLRSLRLALQVLGYPNIYDQEDIMNSFEEWDLVLRHKNSADTFSSIFQGKQVAIGMPTFCFWEEILQSYPNARVILTVRDENEWWASVNSAKLAMDRELPGAPLQTGSVMRHFERRLVPTYHKFCEVLRFAWATILGMYENYHDLCFHEGVARGNYRKHNCYVKSMLQDKTITYPDGRLAPQLLVFNVNDGWEPLCKFLGKEQPCYRDMPCPMESHERLEGLEHARKVMPFPIEKEVNVFPQGVASDQSVNRQHDSYREWDELMQPDAPFGSQLRSELRRGLLYCALAITFFSAVIGVLFMYRELPVIVLSMVYLCLMSIIWCSYVVMNVLVMRVPAIVVWSATMNTLWTVASLHACFISYGMLKETLVTRVHVASPVLILASRAMSVFLAAGVLLVQGEGLSLGAPIKDFAAFAFTNELSTWAGYEMLNYVSFPVQVMAKSVKMLPNMIMGRVLNKTLYTPFEYVQAIVALICVGIMHFSNESSHIADDNEVEVDYMKHLLGGLLLILFFVTDSFTSQWQTALYKKHKKLTKLQMMLAGNLLALVFTAFSMGSRRAKVYQSLILVARNREVLMRVMSLALFGAAGQFCIYSAIKNLGPVYFTWIMMARQLLSVLLSLVFFGHGTSAIQIICIFMVFAVMSFKTLNELLGNMCSSCSKASNMQPTATGAKKRD